MMVFQLVTTDAIQLFCYIYPVMLQIWGLYVFIGVLLQANVFN